MAQMKGMLKSGYLNAKQTAPSTTSSSSSLAMRTCNGYTAETERMNLRALSLSGSAAGTSPPKKHELKIK